MEPEQNHRIPLYVLNNFLKFDRKIYQFFGLKFGRPIPLKGFLYFLVIAVIEITWYFTPILGYFIKWIPPGILFALPIVLAWLLTDMGTEGRSPIAFCRSFILYNIRKMKRVTYLDGREVPKRKTHAFHSYYTYGVKQNLFKPRKYKYKGFMTYNK